MTNRRPDFLPPTVWSRGELDADRLRAIEAFRHERLEEPLEEYLEVFDQVQGTMETLLEGTVDLALLEDQALEILKDPDLTETFRYLAGPPISLDDLKTLVNTNSLAPKVLEGDPALVQRLVETIRTGLDRRRFPWVAEGREPDLAERQAAIIASAALIATQRTATSRRNTGKQAQEERVRQALADAGLRQIEVLGRRVPTLASAPQPGEFCTEVTLGTRKADLIVGLWDRRVMPIECKVSNSSINSVKRLNNDAAAKAEAWRHDLGATQVIPVAVLSGVYKLHNLEDAQRRGLTLYWAHRLDDLIRWIDATRQAQ
jgi:hypothetical protein